MPDDRVVEGEVVGGEPEPEPEKPAVQKRKSFFHPLSGAVILGVDWLAFSADFFSGFLALPLVSILAFVVTFYAVLAIQRRLHGDTPRAAAGKALLGAIAAGVPFPVTGTIVGAAILGLSGLPSLPWKRLKP
jgi:hypothetical protein